MAVEADTPTLLKHVANMRSSAQPSRMPSHATTASDIVTRMRGKPWRRWVAFPFLSFPFLSFCFLAQPEKGREGKEREEKGRTEKRKERCVCVRLLCSLPLYFHCDTVPSTDGAEVRVKVTIATGDGLITARTETSLFCCISVDK